MLGVAALVAALSLPMPRAVGSPPPGPAAKAMRADESHGVHLERFTTRTAVRVEVDAVGDARFHAVLDVDGEMLLSMDKARLPAPAILRLSGLHRGWRVAHDAKAAFDHGARNVTLDWTIKGYARQDADGRWEMPAPALSPAARSTLGKGGAVLDDPRRRASWRFGFPAGSGKVELLEAPARLAVTIPAPADTGKDVRLDMRIRSAAVLLTCAAKFYGRDEAADLWLAAVELRNTGTATARDVRVRFRLSDFGKGWSAWIKVPAVLPGQTVAEVYRPLLDVDALARVAGRRQTDVEVQWRWREGEDGAEKDDSDARRLDVLGRNEFSHSWLPEGEAVIWHEQTNGGPLCLAGMVGKDDPVVQQVAGMVSRQVGGGSYSTDPEDAEKFVRGVWEFLRHNKVAYVTPPGLFDFVDGRRRSYQHSLFARDLLRNRAGTCLDLAIFHASVYEAVGLKAVIYLVPGHAFPGVVLPQRRPTDPIRELCVESTALTGEMTFEQAVAVVHRRYLVPIAEGRKPCHRVDIAAVRTSGLHPLELPEPPADALKLWGPYEPAPPKPAPDPKKGEEKKAG